MTINGAIDVPDGIHLVLVVVGTDHHPFDRVVDWMDRWAVEHADHYCLIQYGTSRRPETCAGVDYLGHPDLQSLMRRAQAVVTHGGPGTIMEVRSTGLQPVVVARDPSRGEHVDGHQQRFVRLMNERGLVRHAATEPDLRQHLRAALSEPRSQDQAAHMVARGAEAAATFGGLVAPLIDQVRARRGM